MNVILEAISTAKTLSASLNYLTKLLIILLMEHVLMALLICLQQNDVH